MDNIVTCARHSITNAMAEGINAKIAKIKRKTCDFRNRSNYRTAIFFHCGGLDMLLKLVTTEQTKFMLQGMVVTIFWGYSLKCLKRLKNDLRVAVYKISGAHDPDEYLNCDLKAGVHIRHECA